MTQDTTEDTPPVIAEETTGTATDAPVTEEPQADATNLRGLTKYVAWLDEAPYKEVLDQPIVNTPTVAAMLTPKDIYEQVLANGNDTQKAMLFTLHEYVNDNSYPFPKSVATAASTQYRFLQGLIKSLTTLGPKDMADLWTAIIYVASNNNSRLQAFHSTCMLAGAVHWARYDKSKYELYSIIMSLISHMSHPERSSKVNEYISRAGLDRLSLDQKLRSSLDNILRVYGL